ncbi:hypothetical protein [Neolewinella agarilytica]|uniref:hypothetical protein n=1 Tax=Neolewinella agarilytica TaxID=478744 RepID=UPI002353BBE3|nr:hypothetical protein [Neolewinella agarilytica]
MKHLTLPAVLMLLLISCSKSDSIESSPPDQWIVVGNDRGLRNEFIDMANLIDVEESNLRVRSSVIPNMELNYPIRDSLVIGSEEEQWRLSRRGRDTLVLFDSVKNNHYYLERLRVVNLDSSWMDYATQKVFLDNGGFMDVSFLFEEKGDQDQGCYMTRATRFIGNQRIWYDQADGFWRAEDRFNQPILSYTLGGSRDVTILIDSIKAGEGLYGRRIDNNNMNGIRRGKLLRESENRSSENPEELLSHLDFSKTKVTLMADSLKNRHTRFTNSGSLPKNIISLAEHDLEGFWLLLDEAGFAIKVGEKNIRQGSFSFHPRANYILLDGGCLNVHYLPYEVLKDGLVVNLPITLIRPGLEPRGIAKGKMFTGVAYFMTELEIEIPFMEGKR